MGEVARSVAAWCQTHLGRCERGGRLSGSRQLPTLGPSPSSWGPCQPGCFCEACPGVIIIPGDLPHSPSPNMANEEFCSLEGKQVSGRPWGPVGIHPVFWLTRVNMPKNLKALQSQNCRFLQLTLSPRCCRRGPTPRPAVQKASLPPELASPAPPSTSKPRIGILSSSLRRGKKNTHSAGRSEW